MIWLVTSAFAGISFESPPQEGQETVVVVVEGEPGGDLAEDSQPTGGATLRVVYRPGLPGEFEQAIGITDARGRARWIPTEGGIALVESNNSSLPMRILPKSFPPTTLILLALISLGSMASAIYGLSRRSR